MKYLISIAINKRMICLFWLALQFQLFAQIRNITINSKLNDDKSIDIEYEKELPGSYYVVLEFANVSNCYIDGYKSNISGYSGRLLTLKPNNPQQRIDYSLKYSSILGTANPKVDSLFQYAFPFKTGKKVTIYEAGNIGEKYFGSEKPANWKSYVVYFKNPDSIFSMRKGIVVRLNNEYDENASIKKVYTSKRNSILIEHEDGTYAEYSGLKKSSFKVKLGQIVYPQTQLGTVELFDKAENKYRFDFNIYYLFDLNNIINYEKQTLKNKLSRYKYLTPKFLTFEGVRLIESKKEYTAYFDENLLFQEMTRSEKKKYLKDPTPFK